MSVLIVLPDFFVKVSGFIMTIYLLIIVSIFFYAFSMER
jgi:hypothetical protein